MYKCLPRHGITEALDAYERALTIDPNNVLAWTSKGDALRGQHRYVEALVAYDQALALDPEYVLAWYGKYHALIALNRDHEAGIASRRHQDSRARAVTKLTS